MKKRKTFSKKKIIFPKSLNSKYFVNSNYFTSRYKVKIEITLLSRLAIYNIFLIFYKAQKTIMWLNCYSTFLKSIN